MEPEERAAAGVFLAFQYPVELPGVGNANFLRTALNALRRARGEAELDAVQFLKLARAEAKRLSMPDDMLKRNVNVGFSGGEKKRNEVLQMAILRPRLAILDETDSGLDIDALRIVAEGVNALRGPDILGAGHHPLPAAAGSYRAGSRACAGGRAHRALRRAGAGAGTGGRRLRIGRGRRRMNAVTQLQPAWLREGAAAFLARYEGLRDRLPGDAAVRDAGAAAFRASGLPGARDEAWHYTSLRALAETRFAEPLTPVADCAALMARLPQIDAPRLVFVDGRFRDDLSVVPSRGVGARRRPGLWHAGAAASASRWWR